MPKSFNPLPPLLVGVTMTILVEKESVKFQSAPTVVGGSNTVRIMEITGGNVFQSAPTVVGGSNMALLLDYG